MAITSESPTIPDSTPGSLGIFGWLAMQAGAIALAALRIPLWAHAPATGEFLAVEILLTTQIIAAALLLPSLTANWRSVLLSILCAWLFTALAGLLAARSGTALLYCDLYVSLWIIVLWAWRSCFSDARWHMRLSAIAAGWAAAGPVLLFITTEYRASPPQTPTGSESPFLGPLANAYYIVDLSASSQKPRSWLGLALALAVGCIIRVVGRTRFAAKFRHSQTPR